jgi:hypothetical protein
MRSKLIHVFALMLATSSYSAARPNPKPKIAMDQAKTTALQKESGTIKSAELEKEQGRWIYSFDIAAADGIHEVNEDANTGKIVEDSVETAVDEAKEAAQEHKKNQKKASQSQKPQ